MRPSTLWAERVLAMALVGITFVSTTALTACDAMLGLPSTSNIPPGRAVHAQGVIVFVSDMYASWAGRASPLGPHCQIHVHVMPEGAEAFEGWGQMDIPYMQIPQYQPGRKIDVTYDATNKYRIAIGPPVSQEGAPTSTN